MKKSDTMVLAVALSLAVIGFFSAFALAFLHAKQGDRGFMIIFFVVFGFGGFVLYRAVRNGNAMLATLSKIKKENTDA